MSDIRRRDNGNDKGDIVSVESYLCEYQGIVIIINYEDGGYDEKSIHHEDIDDEFEYVPEGC